MTMFDPIEYMKGISENLSLTSGKYKFTTVSGIDNLEGVLSNSRRENYFFAVDDSQDGVTFRGAGSGYYERRPYTVFLLGKADYGDMAKRNEVLNETKEVYRHILSRMLKDKTSIHVLKMDQIQFNEVPPAFATGCSGLYFTFTVENPVNLVYDESVWQS